LEVYLDILIIENIVVNFLILYLTARIAKLRFSSWRTLVGAAIGAAYILAILFLPQLKFYSTAAAKIGLSVIMLCVTFSFENFKSFFKGFAVFYILTFTFAGAGFAFIYLSSSQSAVWNGSIVSFLPSATVKWSEIFYSILFVLILIVVFKETVLNRINKERLIVQLIITFNKKAAALLALVDTGNSLRDPLTDMPVVVVEFAAIKEILPEEVRDIFEENKENDYSVFAEKLSGSLWLSRFRLIPFTSIGKENGMLVGFRPDYVEIGNENERKGIYDVIVGIHNRRLSKNEKYSALLNPELI
jgi:stage II sporulation protein GA (sporulation sigma-E factor processing peptidase)